MFRRLLELVCAPRNRRLRIFGLLHALDQAQVVEDGYEFFAKRQLVTLFSAPNYCGEFDNAGGIMSVNEDMVCSFKVIKPSAERRPSHYYK